MAGLTRSRRRGFVWGWWTAAVAHAAGNMARRSRVGNALSSAAATASRSLARVAHLLWLEIAGLFFIAFAVIGGSKAWYEYSHHKTISTKLLLAIAFSLVFGWFGLSSFWRARHRSS